MSPTQAENEFRNFIFDCELTVAVNPVSYTECRLEPPVKLTSFEDFIRFNEEWEKFCRRAAEKGVEMTSAHFELPSLDPAL